MNTIFVSAEEAEDAFYDAIGRSDIDALMNVWANDEEIVCIHPNGQRLSGPMAIRDSWCALFADNPRITMRIERSVCWKGIMHAIHSVVETVLLGDEPIPHASMLSTNVFQRSTNGWRLLSHHASFTAQVTDIQSKPHDDSLRTLH